MRILLDERLPKRLKSDLQGHHARTAQEMGCTPSPYFGEYPRDFFDFIVIDECHRGGANDESNWRDILEYFEPAVQLGLTATPRREDNVDTYKYFGDPVYIYSLKDGINDGYLTPFKVKQISTTLDEYVYTADDRLIEGEVEAGRRYEEKDFNTVIEIKEREAHRVRIVMDQIDQREKTLVFCATQRHALAVRDLINQMKIRTDPNYCQRVTADDAELGEQFLRDFQPRLYDGKDHFTIYDFVKACHHFSDPEWDGEPQTPKPARRSGILTAGRCRRSSSWSSSSASFRRSTRTKPSFGGCRASLSRRLSTRIKATSSTSSRTWRTPFRPSRALIVRRAPGCSSTTGSTAGNRPFWILFFLITYGSALKSWIRASSHLSSA